jgi:hypothetical protein
MYLDFASPILIGGKKANIETFRGLYNALMLCGHAVFATEVQRSGGRVTVTVR